MTDKKQIQTDAFWVLWNLGWTKEQINKATGISFKRQNELLLHQSEKIMGIKK